MNWDKTTDIKQLVEAVHTPVLGQFKISTGICISDLGYNHITAHFEKSDAFSIFLINSMHY